MNRPICAQERIFWAKFSLSWAKNPNFNKRKQKLCHPRNRKNTWAPCSHSFSVSMGHNWPYCAKIPNSLGQKCAILTRKFGHLGKKVIFLFWNRNFCQQGISPVYPGLQLSHSDHPKKNSVSELGVIFWGSPLFLAVLGLCRIIGISTLNFGPFSTKLGETVWAGLDNRIYLMDIMVDNAEIWWKVSQWWVTYSPSVPNHLARVFNRPPPRGKSPFEQHFCSQVLPKAGLVCGLAFSWMGWCQSLSQSGIVPTGFYPVSSDFETSLYHAKGKNERQLEKSQILF